jgi:hypothetical protein
MFHGAETPESHDPDDLLPSSSQTEESKIGKGNAGAHAPLLETSDDSQAERDYSARGCCASYLRLKHPELGDDEIQKMVDEDLRDPWIARMWEESALTDAKIRQMEPSWTTWVDYFANEVLRSPSDDSFPK